MSRKTLKVPQKVGEAVLNDSNFQRVEEGYKLILSLF